MKNICKDGFENHPETAVCEVCRVVIDSEMPFDIGDRILCEDCQEKPVIFDSKCKTCGKTINPNPLYINTCQCWKI